MKSLISIIAMIGLPVAAAIAAPDIEVQKSVDNATPMANEPVQFTVQVSNIGDEAAADVVIMDQLPDEMDIPPGTAAFPSVGTYDPVSGEWIIGNLDPGADATLVVPAIVTAAQPSDCIANKAISQFEDISDDSNDEARAVIFQNGVERCVDLKADFGISASSPLSFFPTCDSEDQYSGDVEISNYGPDTARDVVVTLAQSPIVGPGLRFDDIVCSNAPSSLCQIDEIGSGETITISVTSDLYQSYNTFTQTISVSVMTSDFDYDLSNNDPNDSGPGGGFSSCAETNWNFGDIGPGCFIATAAYGSSMDSRLDVLRGFRDEHMLTNGLGRAMVDLYYRHSPALADFIAERDWLRAIVRGMLAPIIFSIEHPGWAGFAFLCLAGCGVTIRRRWRERPAAA